MAGSSHAVTSRTKVQTGRGSYSNYVEVVDVAWTADSATATIPNLSLDLRGWVIKIITNPGSTAPTDNYDITFGDPSDSTLDALMSQVKDRDTSTTEQVYPVATNGLTPILLAGTYTVAIANNSVNSATGTYTIYLKDSL